VYDADRSKEGRRGWKWFVVGFVVLVVVLGFLAFRWANPVYVDEEVSKRLIEEAVRESHVKAEWKVIKSRIPKEHCFDPWCYVEQVDERTYRVKPPPLYVYAKMYGKLPEPRLGTWGMFTEMFGSLIRDYYSTNVMIGAFRKVIMGEMSVDEAMKWACQHALEQIEKDPLKSFEEPIQYELARGNCIPYLVWEIRGATNWRIEWLAYHWKEMWKPIPPILELDWVTLVAKKHWGRKLPVMPVALIIPQRDNTTLIKLYDLFNESDLKAFWNYVAEASKEKPFIMVYDLYVSGDFIDWLAKVNGINFTVAVYTYQLPERKGVFMRDNPDYERNCRLAGELALKYMGYMFNKHLIELWKSSTEKLCSPFKPDSFPDFLIIYKGRIIGFASTSLFTSTEGWNIENVSLFIYRNALTWEEFRGEIYYEVAFKSLKDIAKYDPVFEKYMAELRGSDRGAFEVRDDSDVKALVLRLYDYWVNPESFRFNGTFSIVDAVFNGSGVFLYVRRNTNNTWVKLNVRLYFLREGLKFLAGKKKFEIYFGEWGRLKRIYVPIGKTPEGEGWSRIYIVAYAPYENGWIESLEINATPKETPVELDVEAGVRKPEILVFNGSVSYGNETYLVECFRLMKYVPKTYNETEACIKKAYDAIEFLHDILPLLGTYQFHFVMDDVFPITVEYKVVLTYCNQTKT